MLQPRGPLNSPGPFSATLVLLFAQRVCCSVHTRTHLSKRRHLVAATRVANSTLILEATRC